MKITINTDENIKDTEVHITCSALTPEIERLISLMRIMELQLTGTKNEETFIIDIGKVLYIDTVDKKTFIYTMDEEYESKLKLYELEEQLAKAGFFRGSKSSIINFRHIVSLKADIDRRLRVTLTNGEQLIVSRQYAEQVKERLGVR
ncbi:MAG: LytTR family DNA-binding domain-containing protein [Clostridiaceae bacterium]